MLICTFENPAFVMRLGKSVYILALIGDKLELQLFIKINTARNAQAKW
jgi:hypothetical protein